MKEKGRIKGPLSFILTILMIMILSTSVFAVNEAEFTQIYKKQMRGEIKIIGNTLQKPKGKTTPPVNKNNNDFTMELVDTDGDTSTKSSSSADLEINTGAKVAKAYLIWGATADGETNVEVSDAKPPTIKFKIPGGEYEELTAGMVTTDIIGSTPSEIKGWNNLGNGGYKSAYTACADVTDLVKEKGGPGTYWVADIPQGTELTDRFGGWSLVVVFEDESKPLNDLSIFFGHKALSKVEEEDIEITGIKTPKNDAVLGKVGMVVWEGDAGNKGDGFLLNDIPLSDNASPIDNFFNSRISNEGVLLTNRNPNFENNMGIDAKIINIDGKLENNVTEARFTFKTDGDWYYPTILTSQIQLYQPEINPKKSVTVFRDGDKITGDAKIGDDLEYIIELENEGKDTAKEIVLTDTLPKGITLDQTSIKIQKPKDSAFVGPDPDTVSYDENEGKLKVFVGEGATGTTGGTLSFEEVYKVKYKAKINEKAYKNGTTNKVAVDYNGEDGAVNLTGETEVTVPMEPENPIIEITKTAEAPTELKVGEKIKYKFEISNKGNVKLQDFTLTDKKLGIINEEIVGSLEPGKTMEVQHKDYFDYQITQDDVDKGIIANTATVTGKSLSGKEDDDTDSAKPIKIPAKGELTFTKLANVGELPDKDGKIKYTFKVKNTGNVTLHDINVADPMLNLSDITWDNKTLAPGKEAEGTATYTVTQDDVDKGLTNVATLTAKTPSNFELKATDSVTLDSTGVAQLEFEKTSDVAKDKSATLGQKITYTFTVKNTGTITLEDIEVEDPFFSSSSITWDKTTLPPNETATGTATYTVIQYDVDNGFIKNQATVTAKPIGKDKPITQTKTLIIRTEQKPDYTLTKTSDKDGNYKLIAGDTIKYRFKIENIGNVKLEDIKLEDKLEGLSNITLDKKVLPKGESTEVSADYIVKQKDVDNGVLTNYAKASANTLNKPEDVDDIIRTNFVSLFADRQPALTLEKTSDKAEDYKLVAGDTIIYTFKAKNTGNVTLTDISVTDKLKGISDVTWDKTEIAPGKTAIGRATYIIKQSDVDKGEIVNTATAKAKGPVGTVPPVSEPASLTIPAKKAPGITLKKTVDRNPNQPLRVGETIIYQFEYENTGNVTLNNITIKDAMKGLSEIEMDRSTLLPGEIGHGKATYTVTAKDIAIGFIKNNAKVSATTFQTDPTVTGEEVIATASITIGRKGGGMGGSSGGSHGSGTIVVKPDVINPDISLNRELHYAYMFGYPQGDFRPERAITRAEAAVLFTRLSVETGDPGVSKAEYPDVPQDTWYSDAVNYLSHKGIIKGYEDGLFRPNQEISRAEFAAIASRYERYSGDTEKTFPDVDKNHWAIKDISSAASAGWINGYPDGTFKPAQSITRAEVVTIVNRMLHRVCDKEFILSHLKDKKLRTFTDLQDVKYWAFFEIMEATNGHDFNRLKDGSEEWIKLNDKDFYYDKHLEDMKVNEKFYK
ncbi:MAG: S-layer homology domain-containing protein [Tissierellia bacterium]|nr:S-layer homology domain-containing protein [Tissierellia bacterium]